MVMVVLIDCVFKDPYPRRHGHLRRDRVTLGRTGKGVDSRIVILESVGREAEEADGWRWEAHWKCGVMLAEGGARLSRRERDG